MKEWPILRLVRHPERVNVCTTREHSVHACGDLGHGQPGCPLDTRALLQQESFSPGFSKSSPRPAAATSPANLLELLHRTRETGWGLAEALSEEGRNACPVDVLQD